MIPRQTKEAWIEENKNVISIWICGMFVIIFHTRSESHRREMRYESENLLFISFVIRAWNAFKKRKRISIVVQEIMEEEKRKF